MKIFDGKTYREMTPEELAELERARKAEEEERKAQPPTDSELVAILTGETA